MKRTISSLWVCVFMSLVGAATAGGETVFLPGTPEVDQLVTMYREAGRVFPTTSFPVSKAELARFAASLATSASGDLVADLQAYQDNVLAFNTTHDSISASGSASFEYTYRTRNVNFDPGLPTEIQILDLQRLFLHQLPLASAMLDYSRDSGFELGISAVLPPSSGSSPRPETPKHNTGWHHCIARGAGWRRTICSPSNG